MRILVLHWHAAGSVVRSSVREHLQIIASAGGGRRTLIYNAAGGAPGFLARLQPDAVMLHTTFLAARWLVPFERWRARSRWIGELGVPVLAFPQDEYDHTAILDEWLVELGATDVFTNFPQAVDDLYPSRAGNALFHPALTGYLTDRPRPSDVQAPPLAARPLDVVYRATNLPYWFGSHGQLKGRLGDEAANELRLRGLRGDISTRPEDVIGGGAWTRFLSSGRVAIGCEGGSSAIDWRGELRQAVQAALARDPGASFEDVSACLPDGWDRFRMFALSPRHLESVASRTAQVLVRGAFSGVLQPERHYIPVEPDLSNLGDALERTRDLRALQELANRAYEEVVASGIAGANQLRDQIARVLLRHGLDVTIEHEPGDRVFAVARPLVATGGSVYAWRMPGAALSRLGRLS